MTRSTFLVTAMLILVGSFFTTVLSVWGATTGVSDLVFEVESNVQSLAMEADASHTQRCALLSSCESNGCTQPGCAKTWDADLGFACNTKYGSSHTVDDTEALDTLKSCKSQIRGVNKSVVRLPSSTHNSKATEEFVCATKRLDSQMALQQASGNLTSWQYVAHSDGGIRLFPGAPQDNGATCSPYDARQRPWYLAASNGPRDVIILLSTSNNTQGEKMVLAKCIADTVLQSLGQNDYVDLITFHKSTTSQGGNELQRATPSRVLGLRNTLRHIDYVDSADSGLPQFKFAFSVAFSELFSSPRSTNCQKVIIFLTDGYAADGYSYSFGSGSKHDIRLHINHLRELKKTHAASGKNRVAIFTYGIKLEPHEYTRHYHYRSNLVAIACDNYGAFTPVDSRADPVTSLGSYFRMMAAAVSGDTTVRWTSPYTDAFGMGQMVTASRALWDKTTSVPSLVGVVGIDVPTSQFGNLTTSTIAGIQERSTYCPTFKGLTECQMQRIRQESFGGYTCGDGYVQLSTCGTTNMKPTDCSSSIKGTANRFCTPLGGQRLETADYTCCGMERCGGAEVPRILNAVFLIVVLCLAVVWPSA